MGSLRRFVNSAADKFGSPASALGDVATCLAAVGVDGATSAAGLIKVTAGLSKAVAFLTDDERSWSGKPEPDDFLENTFNALCHDAFLAVAVEALLFLPADTKTTKSEWEERLLNAFKEIADEEIDFEKIGPTTMANVLFDRYELKLLTFASLDVATKDWLNAIRQRAYKRVMQRLTDGSKTMVRLQGRISMGSAEQVSLLARRLDAFAENGARGLVPRITELGDLGSTVETDNKVAQNIEVTVATSNHAEFKKLQGIVSAINSDWIKYIRLPATELELVDEEKPRDLVAEFFADAKATHDRGETQNALALWQTLHGRLRNTEEGKREDYAARTSANLGLCHLHLGEKQQAQDRFREAYATAPHNPRMRFFGALGLHLEGAHQAARPIAEELVKDRPELPDIRWLMAGILSHLDGHPAAIAFLRQHEPATENDYTALCHYLNEEGLHSEAHALAIAGLDRFPTAHPLLHSAAYALAVPLIDRKTRECDYLYVRNADERCAAEEAVRLTTKAIELARRTQHRLVLPDYYANLVSFLSLTGDNRHCLDIAVEASALGAENGSLLSNVFLCAARVNDWAKMEQFMQKLRDRDGADSNAHHRRELLHAMLIRDASSLDRALTDTLAGSAKDAEISFIRIEAMLSAGRWHEASLALKIHRERFGDEAGVAFAEGELAMHDRQWRIADGKFIEAGRSLEFKHRARGMRGMVAYREHRWADALDFFKRSDLAREYSMHLGEQAHCLLELGRYEECVTVVQLARASNEEPDHKLDEIEAASLVRQGRFSDALPCIVSVCEHGDSAYFWLKRYELLMRLNQTTEANRVLGEAEKRYRGDPDLQVAICHKHLHEGNTRPAYEAARCALALAPGSRDAKLAMGRIAPLAMQDKELSRDELAEVLRYATETGLVKPIIMPVKDGEPDVAAFLENLRKLTGNHRHKPIDPWHWFKHGGQPLTMGAHELGFGVAAVWTAITESRGYAVNAAFGGGDDQRLDNTTAQAAIRGEVVIDAVAVLTCDLLGLWDLLPSLFTKIYVPDSVAEALFKELMQARQKWIHAYSIGKLPHLTGELALTDDSHVRMLARLERVAEHINRAPFVRATVTERTVERWRRYRKLRGLPIETFEAAAIAWQVSRPLWSDDIYVSATAAAAFHANRFPTCALLSAAGKTGVMPPSLARENSLHLARHNYRFTPVTIDAVLEAYNSRSDGPSTMDSRLFDSIVNTSFPKRPASGLLGYVAAKMLFVAWQHSREWRDFAVEQLLQWTPKRLVYEEFCCGVAEALDHAPELFFGIIRAAASRMDAKNAKRFLVVAATVAREYATLGLGSSTKWKSALRAFEQHPPVFQQ